MPGPPEGRDGTVHVTACHAQVGVDAEAAAWPFVTRKLPAHDRSDEVEGLVRVVGHEEQCLVTVLTRRAVETVVARLGSPGREVASHGVPCADVAGEACSRRVDRTQGVALGAQHLFEVVHRCHDVVEADLRRVLHEVDRPGETPQDGIPVSPDQTPTRVEGTTEPGHVLEVLRVPRHVEQCLGEIQAGHELLGEGP